jgi:hypothetical protein
MNYEALNSFITFITLFSVFGLLAMYIEARKG